MTLQTLRLVYALSRMCVGLEGLRTELQTSGFGEQKRILTKTFTFFDSP